MIECPACTTSKIGSSAFLPGVGLRSISTAIEGGKKSAIGSLYNEFPDRIADSLLIVGSGMPLRSATLSNTELVDVGLQSQGITQCKTAGGVIEDAPGRNPCLRRFLHLLRQRLQSI